MDAPARLRVLLTGVLSVAAIAGVGVLVWESGHPLSDHVGLILRRTVIGAFILLVVVGSPEHWWSATARRRGGARNVSRNAATSKRISDTGRPDRSTA